jgi:hypothetical protein
MMPNESSTAAIGFDAILVGGYNERIARWPCQGLSCFPFVVGLRTLSELQLVSAHLGGGYMLIIWILIDERKK